MRIYFNPSREDELILSSVYFAAEYTSWENSEGDLHRIGGPAFYDAVGTAQWRHNGAFHREDGPAIFCADGEMHY